MLVVLKQILVIRESSTSQFLQSLRSEYLETVLVWHYHGIEKCDLYVVSSALSSLVGVLQWFKGAGEINYPFLIVFSCKNLIIHLFENMVIS
jgi:hypothetical protein